MKFYNRERELAKLHEIEQKALKAAQFTVVTGRRRIGKTQLLLRAFENKPALYFFVARKSEVLLCQDFILEIKTKLQTPIVGNVSSFSILFDYIVQLAKKQAITLIIDEFQEFFSVNPAIYSDIQRIWDLNKDKIKLNLIVSGSVISLMHKIFENNKEPLFGRAQHFMRIKSFDTLALKAILRDHNPAYHHDDLLALYSFTGGVAKYVQLLMDNGAVTKDRMISEMIMEDSLFINEGKNTLIEEFGRDYGIYFSILSAISDGYNRRTEIENLLQKEIGGYITRLEDDFQLIQKAVPIFSKSKTKNIKYRIEDNFLIFWFRFLYKYSSMVEIGAYRQLREIIKRDYSTFSGMMLEKYFRTRSIESELHTNIGNYWDRKGEIELDFIAVNDLEKRMDVAEIKRNPSKFKIDKLQQKFSLVLDQFPKMKNYEVMYHVWGLNDM